MQNLLRFILLGLFSALILSGIAAEAQKEYVILDFAYADSSTITDGSVTGGDLANPLRIPTHQVFPQSVYTDSLFTDIHQFSAVGYTVKSCQWHDVDGI